ncbi:hypothetical protein HY522_11455 [bacterium]|nr:hypothetical protein [bacterium]
MPDSSTPLQKWMALSKRAAGFLLVILFYIFYFTFFLPAAVIFRAVSDPLRRAPGPSGRSFFVARRRQVETRESASHPF